MTDKIRKQDCNQQTGRPCPKCGKDLWWFYGFLACVGSRGHGLFRLVQTLEPVVERKGAKPR